MARVRFLALGRSRDVEMPVGATLLQASKECHAPEGDACGGVCACSTCHVIVAAEWFAKLAPASEDEEDMLDLAAGVTRTSRLSCQIVLSEALDGLEVRIPGEAHDMQRW